MGSLRTLLNLALLAMLLLGMSTAALAEPLSLGKDIPYSLLVDAPGQLSFVEAEQALRDEPTDNQVILSRGYTDDTFWLRFELAQTLFKQKELWLELQPNFIDDIQIFFREKGVNGPWQQRKTGDLLNGVSDLDYRNSVFILPPPSVDIEGYEIVVRVSTTSSVILSARLWTPAEFVGYASLSTAFWSFYFGLAALSTLFALILAITLRTYLLWSTTVFAVTYVLVISIQGYVNWLFPSLTWPLQHYLTSVGSLTTYAMLLWMSSELINLRERLRWAHRLLLGISFIILALLVLIPFGHYGTAVKIKSFLLFPAYSLFLYSVAHLWVNKRIKPASLSLAVLPVFFMLASLFSLFSIMGWVPFYPELYVVWQYAIIVNMLLVLAISVYRIRKRRQEEFEQQKLANELEAEREASFNQRQFIGTVSHEFRTPLAVISAALENLRLFETDKESPRLARYNKIDRASARLIQLTDNCLADTRLATDITSLDLQPTDLLELVHSAASLVHVSDTHRLAVSVNGQPISSSTPLYHVEADSAMMRIALSNVIDNAVKYSGSGLISIDCRTTVANVFIRICDQGPGIGDLEPEILFQRYRRGTTSKQGTGLGLYVARQIAQASGGQLTCISNIEQGCCFEFRLNHATGSE